ncbi:MAG TPA: CBS domain-containing protein [Dehalococcoidia bacterium]|nr:CBS domain-containing protein [Dehalococcoidia bacterium]
MAHVPATAIDADLIALSEIVASPVVERQGERIARVKDVVARVREGGYPLVTGLVSRAGGRDFFVPIDHIAEIRPGAVRLNTAAVDVGRFHRRDGELMLVSDVLDRQVIDVRGTRVVRVNDLYLSRSYDGYRVVALDTGGRAILRRLVPGGMRGRFPGRMLTDWREVEYLTTDTPAVRLKVGHLQLRKLRPQQLARIVSELSKQEGAEVLSSLDEEHAADTLEELSTEQQAQLLSAMPVEQAADLIEEMEPDEAADVLAKVPAPRAEELLHEMEEPESQAVRRLLEYAPDTAGGVMTTNVLTIAPGRPVSEALRVYQTREDAPDFAYYFFVLDEQSQLVGVLSMRQVLIAAPGALVRDVMTRELETVTSDEEPQRVAEKIAEYNLLAIPVVDEERRFLGAITVDDVLDVVLKGSWRRGRSRGFGG